MMKFLIPAVLLLPLLASANDGIASVSAGGIVFRKTDAIAMKKEVLSVSRRLISVDYEFVNESKADVEETIVFPLPAYPAFQEPSDTYYGQPSGFSIEVDGKPVGFRTVVRALHDDVDVTAQLRKLGLSDAQERQLAKLKLYGEAPDSEHGPLWEVQVSYVWQQKFPANQPVRVHHAYRPFHAGGPGEWAQLQADAGPGGLLRQHRPLRLRG